MEVMNVATSVEKSIKYNRYKPLSTIKMVLCDENCSSQEEPYFFETCVLLILDMGDPQSNLRIPERLPPVFVNKYFGQR